MKCGFHQFNIYLLSFLMVLAAGCNTPSPEKDKETGEQAKVKPEKEASTLEFYLEVNPDGTDRNHPIQLYRDHAVTINVMRAPFIEMVDIESAAVVEVLGGFSIKVQLTRPTGARRLEQATSQYRGQRIAIFSQFGEARWLAAPRITSTIANGEFFFTPDASREEAERIVRGVNNVLKEGRKKKS